MEFELVLHVTPRKNFLSIMDCGLLPQFSTGKRQVVWLATPQTLSWALAHIAHKRDLKMSELMVFRAVVDKQFLTRTRWQGVYTCKHPVLVSGTVDLEHFLENPENGA